MRNIWTITARDMSSYFYSPIFYIVTTIFLALQGFMFHSILSFFSFQSYQTTQMQQMGMNLNVNEMVIEPSLLNMSVILLLISPLITMRSFSEEKKNKTFNLLLSSPVRLSEVVAGKFFACLGVIGLMVVSSSVPLAFVLAYGEPEIGPILTGYAGLLLMVGCYVSAGVFASSLTDNQLVAAVITFGFVFFMWIIGWAAQSVGDDFGQVLEFLSLVTHLQNFVKGVVDTGDLSYFLSFMIFTLFLTYRVLESARWR